MNRLELDFLKRTSPIGPFKWKENIKRFIKLGLREFNVVSHDTGYAKLYKKLENVLETGFGRSFLRRLDLPERLYRLDLPAQTLLCRVLQLGGGKTTITKLTWKKIRFNDYKRECLDVRESNNNIIIVSRIINHRT